MFWLIMGKFCQTMSLKSVSVIDSVLVWPQDLSRFLSTYVLIAVSCLFTEERKGKQMKASFFFSSLKCAVAVRSSA